MKLKNIINIPQAGRLCVLALTICSALWLSGCRVDAESLKESDAHYLPKNAKVEKELGNGWVVFSVDGRQYIYRYNLQASATTEVLAAY